MKRLLMAGVCLLAFGQAYAVESKLTKQQYDAAIDYISDNYNRCQVTALSLPNLDTGKQLSYCNEAYTRSVRVLNTRK